MKIPYFLFFDNRKYKIISYFQTYFLVLKNKKLFLKTISKLDLDLRFHKNQ